MARATQTMSEADIKDAVMCELARLGAFIWNNPTGTFLTLDGRRYVKCLPGIADVMGVLPGGRAFAVETKTAIGKQRDSQKKFQAAFEKKGGLYVVLRGVADIYRVKELADLAQQKNSA